MLQVSHVRKILHSSDISVREIAQEQVWQAVQKRFILDPDHWRGRVPSAVQLFLNGELDSSPFARQKRKSGDIGSLWVDVKDHLASHGLKFSTESVQMEGGVAADVMLQIKVPHHPQQLCSKDITRQLQQHTKLSALKRWKTLTTQSDVVRAVGGAGSSFVSRGGGLSDAEYRFALAARVDLVPTRSVLRRWNERGSKTCRHPRCSRDETLPHVLQHCPGNARAIDGRHDQVLALIKTAMVPAMSKPGSNLTASFDAHVDGLADRALRPDIQLFDAATKTAYVCDLAVAYEAQNTDDAAAGSMSMRHAEKVLKYQRVKTFLESLGWRVHLSALVYGALGSVLPSNFKTLT